MVLLFGEHNGKKFKMTALAQACALTVLLVAASLYLVAVARLWYTCGILLISAQIY